MQFWLTLWLKALFAQQDHTYFLWLGLAYGMLGLMAVYNVVVFALLRKRQYLYYLLFLTGTTLWLAMRDGIVPLYLPPNFLEGGNIALRSLASAITMIFGIMFVRAFLELPERVPWFDLIMRSLIGIVILMLLVVLITQRGGVLMLLLTLSVIIAANPGRRAGLASGSSISSRHLFARLGELSSHSGNTQPDHCRAAARHAHHQLVGISEPDSALRLALRGAG